MTNTIDESRKSGRWTTRDTSLSLIFNSFVIDPDYGGDIIDRALEYREEASDSARGILNSAIKDSVEVAGFRDSSKAVTDQLRNSVTLEVFSGNDRLAAGVLRVWEESQEELRDFVAEYLKNEGIPAEGPNIRNREFNSIWPRREWRRQRDEIVDADSDGRFDENDIGLMVCYVSGRLADPNRVETAGIDSELILAFIDDLDELPPDSHDWEYIDPLINALTQLDEDKTIQRNLTQDLALREATDDVNLDFVNELSYLGLRIDPWGLGNQKRKHIIPEALVLIEELKSALEVYSPIRPQADTRTEEMERAPRRFECESTILSLAERWHELMAAPEVAEELNDSPGMKAEDDSTLFIKAFTEHGDSEANYVSDAVASELDSLRQASGSLRSENDQLRQVSESLSSEKDRLIQDRVHLRADLNALNDQIAQLRRELGQSQEMQEHWRRGYVLASAGQARPESEEPAQLSNVDDALELAEKSFPDRIRLALNSKSNSNTPFQKPDEVFNALAWLATEYHRLRTNPGDAPNFDMLIKSACPGWSYKPKQTEVTKDQFTEWYTTTLDGKSYGLDAHIGKGTSYDPHQTIRIAFDWDDELKQVIVGFVGRHQKNRNS